MDMKTAKVRTAAIPKPRSRCIQNGMEMKAGIRALDAMPKSHSWTDHPA